MLKNTHYQAVPDRSRECMLTEYKRTCLSVAEFVEYFHVAAPSPMAFIEHLSVWTVQMEHLIAVLETRELEEVAPQQLEHDPVRTLVADPRAALKLLDLAVHQMGRQVAARQEGAELGRVLGAHGLVPRLLVRHQGAAGIAAIAPHIVVQPVQRRTFSAGKGKAASLVHLHRVHVATELLQRLQSADLLAAVSATANGVRSLGSH